jgi:hypothetical protein
MGHVACKLPQNTREATVTIHDRLRAFATVCNRHAPIAHPVQLGSFKAREAAFVGFIQPLYRPRAHSQKYVFEYV